MALRFAGGFVKPEVGEGLGLAFEFLVGIAERELGEWRHEAIFLFELLNQAVEVRRHGQRGVVVQLFVRQRRRGPVGDEAAHAQIALGTHGNLARALHRDSDAGLFRYLLAFEQGAVDLAGCLEGKTLGCGELGGHAAQQ